MPDPAPDLSDADSPDLSDARSIEQLLSAGEDAPLWDGEELAAILRHQLSAPLDFDVGSVMPDSLGELRSLSGAAGEPLGTFSDLFTHPRPPVRLLELAKQFAKQGRRRPDTAVPDEISTVVYFLAIVVAMTRTDGRISKLDNAALRHSLQWAVALPWLDEQSRAIFEEGLAAIGSEGDGSRA